MTKTNNDVFSFDKNNNNLTYIIDDLYEGTPQRSFTFSDFHSSKTNQILLTTNLQCPNNSKNENKSKTIKLKSIEEISKDKSFTLMYRIAQEIFDARKEMFDVSTPLSPFFKSSIKNFKGKDEYNNLSDISDFELED